MDIITVNDPSGVEDITTPGGFLLQQNRPNPFTSRTDIRFHIARPQPVRLTVYDSAGRRIRRLLDTTPGTGWQQVTWDGRNDAGRSVAGGVYYAQLRTNATSKAVIMQLVR
jgi:flagellar hook assembly protein FlgD